MKKKKKEDHKHEAEDVGQVYETCKCGAVRIKDRPGEPKDEWHVCDLCRQ